MLVLCPFLVRLAVWMLSWSDSLPGLQVAFVMMIFPLIMNSFQYYVIDNIIQSPEYYKSNKRLQKQAQIQELNSDDDNIHGFLGQPKPRVSEADTIERKEIQKDIARLSR